MPIVLAHLGPAVALNFRGTLSGQPNFRAFAEQWNGRTWAVVTIPSPPGDDTRLHAVTATTTNAWAVGSDANHSLIEHRNSALAWSVVPSPANEPAGGELDAITAVSANDIWAVGHSRSGSVGNAFEPLIEHWNGTAWTLVPSPSVTAGNAQDTLSSVSAIGSSDVWASALPCRTSRSIRPSLSTGTERPGRSSPASTPDRARIS